MKILSISGKNLASLEGEFIIDFTREPLLSAGIYAITGSTGSGKSTILDALCLALFAKSPRQAAARETGVTLRDGESGSVTPGDSRTILRKGSAEGFAAVAFESAAGTPWNAEWNVRRARNKPGGTLQDYSMKLTNLITNIPFPGTKTEILREIERLIGLSFDQFTRSVLLAQGDFTAFLKAGRDEKASLLEKITGTSIYSQISKTIFQKSRDADSALREIQNRLSGIALPEEEEINNLKSLIKQLETDAGSLEKQKNLRKKEVEWHNQKEYLDSITREALTRVNECKVSLEESAPRENLLTLIEKVEPARPMLNSLKEKREAFDLKLVTLTDTEGKIKTSQSALETLNDRKKEAEQALGTAQKALTDARPLLLKARELDTLMAEQHKNSEKTRDEKDKAFQEQQQARELLKAKELEISHLDSEKQELKTWFETKNHHKRVAENATLIASRLNDALISKKEIAGWSNSLEDASDKMSLLLLKKNAQTTALQEKENELEELNNNLRPIEEEMAAIPVEELTESETREIAGMERASAMLTCWEKLFDLNFRRSENEKELTSLGSSLGEVQARLDKCLTEEKEVKIRKEQTRHLLDQAQLAVARDVEQLRHQLSPGEACPVCGSTRHPWAESDPQLPAILGEMEKEHAAITKKHEELVAESARLTESRAHHESTIVKLNEDLGELITSLETVTREWEEFNPGEELSSLPPEMRQAVLQDTIKKHRHSAQKARDSLDHHKKLTDTAVQLRKRFEQVREQKESARHILMETITEQKLLTGKTEEWEALRLKSRERLNDTISGITPCFPHPGWEERWAADPEIFTAKLLAFAEEWNEKSVRLTDVIQKERILESEHLHCRKRVAETTGVAGKAEAGFQEALKLLSDTRKSRLLLFAGRNADAVEEELTRKVEENSEKFKGLTLEAVECRAGISELEGSYRQLREDAEALKGESETLTTRIEEWLFRFNQSETQQLNSEKLQQLLSHSPEWINSERRALQLLRDELLKADSTHSEREKQLEAHLISGKDIGDKNEVEQMVTATEEELRRVNSELTAARLKLHTFEENQKTAGALGIIMEGRSLTAEKWKKLNELLGSADGKKFRQIAQEYTLEFLLTHANFHLKELSGRYGLQVIPDTLSLQVIDRDMGDEIRSVHSLSGGESFLVSLAMALGLASLSSNRMTIESLFIDEGFGSLDPQTLGIAMDALERLRNQGRKVGVISHVQEMTERIRTQIRVIKRSSGRSKVEVITV